MIPKLSTHTKRASGSCSLCRHAAEASCNSGRLLPILPAKESLVDALCQIQDKVMPTPTWVQERGFEERDAVERHESQVVSRRPSKSERCGWKSVWVK